MNAALTERPAPGYLVVLPWEIGEPGGVNQVVLNLCRELASLGWVPTLLITTWSARAPELDTSGQFPVLRGRIRSPWGEGNHIQSLLMFLLTLPGALRTWRSLARRHNWRIVNPHYPGFATFTWILLKRLRLWNGKVVISVHGRDIRQAFEGTRFERWLVQRLLMAGDATVAPSAELAADVVQLAPRLPQSVRVIPNGVDPDRLKAEVDPTFTLPAGLASRRFVLNVATFEHKKSQDILLEAFALVAAQHPDVHLVLVGRSTPWVEEIRRRAAASGVANRVHLFFNVPHHQIPTFLSHASVFCLPSRSEGHPVAILEAAAYGLPVVATPVGGIPETVPDDHHGLLVPVGDVDALAAALNRLLFDAGLARALGGRLQRFVETKFRWAESARRYAELATSECKSDR
jgi:glycosyltransferase involved in cell wall biosynthesis